MKPFSGLLLAGGQSRRMGQDKAQLDWRGRPLGEHQAATLIAAGASPLFLSCRADQPWTPVKFTRLEDRVAEGGALGAFVEALTTIAADMTLVLAIDLPLVQAPWLEALAVRAIGTGLSVVPVRGNRFEPFAAAWHRSALPGLRETLAQNRSLQDACVELGKKMLLHAQPVSGADAETLANLNTPAEMARFGG